MGFCKIRLPLRAFRRVIFIIFNMKKLLQIPKVLFGILVVVLLGCTTLQAQSVQIISPNGGESWLGGSTRAITWNYTNVDNIRIEYSLDNGLTWLLLSSSYPASALGINWVVPAIGSNQCKVRITSVLFFTQDESNTTFTIPEPIVLLSYPIGGESFGTGTGQYIEWSTVGVANVVAQYSTDNVATWTDIGTFPAGNNYCNWVAPSTINSQTKIRVYNVENAINQATSPAFFSITNVPTTAPEKYRGGINDGYKMASSLPDAITVTAPNGGETFYPTNVVNISWTFRNTDYVKIEYSLNNGNSWNLITAAVAADTQTYPWTIPNSPSTQCLIKVSELGSALNDVSNATFTINSAFVTVTYPNGGESFGEGTGQYIEWDFNSVATVLLEYSLNNGATWTSIGTAPASNKYANWVAPAGANSQCLIRISDISTPLVSDTTDATFAITTVAVADVAKYRGGAYDGYSMAKNLPDNITVTSPNGGETWTGASTRTISWTYTNVDNVSVEFSLDDGITWTTLAANLPASQLSYSWTVPTTPSYLCRIRVKDLISPVSDMNDTAFIIPNSWVQLKYPNGGESFGGGTGQYIEWDYNFIQTIKLEYSINNGTTWSVIGTANAADKYANWVAPLDVSNQILIRATDVNNALFTDTSDLVFSNFALPTIAPEKYYGGANDGYSMYVFKDVYINVIKPNGGEIWGNGTVKNIDFTSLNLPTSDLLKIEYSIDNESIWNTLATNVSRTASPYVWTIASSPSSIAKVRISNMDGTIFDKSDNFFTIANINGIVTNALGANSFCSGQTATVNFSINTTFNAGNKFIVQLSDAQGTFSGALINIGEITSQIPSPITVTFPAIYTSSSLYRIRVIATNTPTIGTDNGTNFTINPLPSVNLGGQATICSDNSLTLNATNAGSTYLWSTGATTPTISVNSAGTYQVAVTNSCGTTTDAIVVQIKNIPVVNLGPDTAICLNSALQLNAGNTDATYLWSTGATTSSISVVTPGTYTVTVTNNCGSNTDSITITNLPQITVDLGTDKGLCAGQNLVLNAGNPGSTYLWSTGATSQSITVTTPGNYTVGVTNSCGTVSDQISIYNGSFTVNAGADQTICTGSSTVLNATGGNTYSWNTGATTSSITVAPTANTTYTVTSTNIYGCTATDQVAVVVNPTVTPTFTIPAATCSGGTSPLLPTSNNGISGTWSPAFNNAVTTTYTFTPSAGQCANTTTQTITISNPKVTSEISFEAPVASLTSVTIGTQVWTNKNLDVTTYRDGTPIPQVTDPTAWANLTTGAWCYYNNDPANGAIYGKLYNWYAVAGIHDNDPNTPNKILAPIGWHAPTDAEWTILTDYLGGLSIAGGAMRETGTTHWWTLNGATNISGFTGLGGGARNLNGSYISITDYGYFWRYLEHIGCYLRLIGDGPNADRDFSNKGLGFSVRLVKD
jgi:uncharacterized protein (TIGR02145 family)